MTVKIKNSGLYMSKVNGKPIINNQYALDIDSTRDKSKQVLGLVSNNGIIERTQDTLHNYMKKMSSKNQSIFDVLKQEHNNLNNIPNASSVPNVSNVPLGVIKKMKALKTRKMRDHSGISSKLFDFSPVTPLVNANANANALTRKKKRKKASRRARRNPKL
jgi:hypothetical protein